MPRPNEELQSEVKLAALRSCGHWLTTEGNRSGLLLPGDRYCHGRLVAEFLHKHGIVAEEYSDPASQRDESVVQALLF